jgi:hypothetical protein
MGETHGFSRRGFIHTAAGATALAFGPGLSLNALAHDGDNHDRTLPAPKPIPGGLNLGLVAGLAPPYDFIHVFPPGPEDITLPFTGGTLQGLDVEPSTLTDFHGATAVAYHVGEARGSDGHTYNLETDMRVMEGKYVAVDGTTRHGSFALIWIDLFEPGSGSQVHDNVGGILLSGLFWTVELPHGAFRMSPSGRRAILEARELPVIDTFQFANAFVVPATVSFKIEWEATGRPVQLGSGNTVPATDPAAFLGTFAPARSTGQFSGAELGFSFVSKRGASTDLGYAQIGTERNGVFLS